MIKKMLSGIAVLAIVAVVGMNINVNLQGAKQGSGIMLTKAEALATENEIKYYEAPRVYDCVDGEEYGVCEETIIEDECGSDDVFECTPKKTEEKDPHPCQQHEFNCVDDKEIAICCLCNQPQQNN